MRPSEPRQGSGAQPPGHRTLALIVLLALVLRVAFFLAVQPWDAQVLESRVLVRDALEYHTLAVELLEEGSFASFGALRTPGYPVLVAVAYFLFGVAPWPVLLLQVFMGAGAVLLLYALAKGLFSRRVALLAAFLYAVEPHTVMYCSTLLTDTLFAFLFLASVVVLLRGLRDKRVWLVAGAGLLLGLATLVRPVVQFFPAVAAAIVVIYAGLKWRFRVLAVASLLAAFVLAISPWLYRNHAAYGHASLSSIEGHNLLLYNATYAEVAKTGKPVDQVRAEFRQQAAEQGAYEAANPFEEAQVYRDIAVGYIASNLRYYIPRHLMGAVNMYLNLATKEVAQHLGLPTNPLPFDFFASPGILGSVVGFFAVKSLPEIVIGLTVGLFLLVCYLAFLAGGISMVRAKQYRVLAILLLIILYFTALTGVVGLARYKQPIIPFYLPVSACGLLVAYDWTRQRRRSRLSKETAQ